MVKPRVQGILASGTVGNAGAGGKSVSADLLTPVSAFLAIAEKEPHAFLLESVERGEQIGRYTFLGVRPYMRLRARGLCHRNSTRDGSLSDARAMYFKW